MLTTASLLAAAGCSQAGSQPRSQNLALDQTLRFAISDDGGTRDPAQVYASADIQVAQNLFDGLVRYDNALNVVPDLAVALPEISPDQLTYTLKLRPDAVFSNGDRVTSRAAAIVKGRDAVAWLEKQALPARLVGVDGKVVTVGGWPRSEEMAR